MKRSMKKGITVLVLAFIIFGLAACGSSAAQSGQEAPVQNAAAVTDDNTQNETVSTEIQGESTTENMDADETENAADFETGTEDGTEPETVAENDAETGIQDDEDTQDMNVLVAYFSATNTTKGVAEHIANGLNADLYEIVPVNPYTDADLNYNDNNSRSTIEMNDPSSRPEISGSVENMDQYKAERETGSINNMEAINPAELARVAEPKFQYGAEAFEAHQKEAEKTMAKDNETENVPVKSGKSR